MQTAVYQDLTMTGERLESVREKLKINKSELARRIGSPQSHINRVLSGKEIIGKHLSEQIVKRLQLNTNWWDTGEGEMFMKGDTIITNSHNNFSNHSGSNNRQNIGGEANNQVPGEDSTSLQNQVDQLRQALAEKDAALLAAKDEIIDLLKKASNK